MLRPLSVTYTSPFFLNAKTLNIAKHPSPAKTIISKLPWSYLKRPTTRKGDHLPVQVQVHSFPKVSHLQKHTQSPVTRFIGIKIVPKTVNRESVSLVSLFAFAISILICAK